MINLSQRYIPDAKIPSSTPEELEKELNYLKGIVSEVGYLAYIHAGTNFVASVFTFTANPITIGVGSCVSVVSNFALQSIRDDARHGIYKIELEQRIRKERRCIIL